MVRVQTAKYWIMHIFKKSLFEFISLHDSKKPMLMLIYMLMLMLTYMLGMLTYVLMYMLCCGIHDVYIH